MDSEQSDSHFSFSSLERDAGWEKRAQVFNCRQVVLQWQMTGALSPDGFGTENTDCVQGLFVREAFPSHSAAKPSSRRLTAAL